MEPMQDQRIATMLMGHHGELFMFLESTLIIFPPTEGVPVQRIPVPHQVRLQWSWDHFLFFTSGRFPGRVLMYSTTRRTWAISPQRHGHLEVIATNGREVVLGTSPRLEVSIKLPLDTFQDFLPDEKKFLVN